jgi:hypothetical protein
MRKNVYEIFDEFAAVNSKQEKIQVLAKNWSPTLKLVLQLAYRPEVNWMYKDYPERFRKQESPPGLSWSTLDTELKRLYLFQKGNPAAEVLTEKKRIELLTTYLESLEPREADVVIGIFRKDLGVKGLTTKFLRDNIPEIFQ